MKRILNIIFYKLFGKAIEKKAFFKGVKEYEVTGKTSSESYQALIKLYCLTDGGFNEEYHQRTKDTNPPTNSPELIEGLSDTLSKSKFNEINSQLVEDGYVTLKEKLPKEVCEKIYSYALHTGAKVPPNYDKAIIYDPLNPVSEIYRFDINDIANNEDVQKLMMDPVLINIARNYLECEPILDFPAMWWSTAFSKKASSEAAQLYHFDMDRVKWLKIFIYLNDVDMENGPHSYIRGSHKIGAKPKSILKRGYVRVEDSELASFYKPEDFITLVGGQGEIFVGDTKCWHKGNALKKGNRLVFELEYSAFLFGANYPGMVISKYSPEFKSFCEANPVYASRITFQ